MNASQVVFICIIVIFAPFAAWIWYHFVRNQDVQPIRARYPTLVLVQTAVVCIYVALLCANRIAYVRRMRRSFVYFLYLLILVVLLKCCRARLSTFHKIFYNTI